jgi:hypothetical protein
VSSVWENRSENENSSSSLSFSVRVARPTENMPVVGRKAPMPKAPPKAPSPTTIPATIPAAREKEKDSAIFGEVVPKFEYTETDVADIDVAGVYDKNGRFLVSAVLIDGEELQPTQRFWNSVCSRFNVGPSIYQYFSHPEVFKRVAEVMKNQSKASSSKRKKDRVRVCIQRSQNAEFRATEDLPQWKPQALAISFLDKAMIFDDQLKNVLATEPPTRIQYDEGVITTQHKLRRAIEFDVGGDMHTTMIHMETPIDGYGTPNVYLAFLRHACMNGAVALSKVFRSGVTLGKGDNAPFALQRALESFSSEDGFMTIKRRLESAQKSQSSVFEARKLAKLIWELSDIEFSDNYLDSRDVQLEIGSERSYGLRDQLLDRLAEKTGDLRALYGVAQIDSVSEKRQRALPTQCRVYELLNLASEVATYQVVTSSARKFHAYFGDMISKEFDIEGSEEAGYKTFEDFVDPASKAARDQAELVEITN